MNPFFLFAMITANPITTPTTASAVDNFAHVTTLQCKMNQGYQGAWNKEALSLNAATMDTEIVFDQISLEN